MELCIFDLHEHIQKWNKERIAVAQRVQRAWDITDQISHGLAFIHAEGVIHRDIKPKNSIKSFNIMLIVIQYCILGLIKNGKLETLELRANR